ncbi:MAG: ATP-binding cassette domain-containing protein [Anaerolineae bacterium]
MSFTLDEGQFLLVSGPNGVGKSTSLRCLYRSYLPSGGHAVHYSQYGEIDLARAADVDILSLRHEIVAFVTQFCARARASAPSNWSVEPLLGLRRHAGRRAKTGRSHAGDVRAEARPVGRLPDDLLRRRAAKVNLARADIAPRRLLLLDEPTASLYGQQSLAYRLAERRRRASR